MSFFSMYCGGPEGRNAKKPTRLQEMLTDDPYESPWAENLSIINKAIFQAPAPTYTKQ
jgi:hypothetical protein